MKIISLSAILILAGICTYGQNLIGYNDEEIRRYMKENRREMSYNSVTNKIFKYLKYSDSSDSQTLLFFLNPDSVCIGVRLICDLSMRAEKVKEFNSVYQKHGKNSWIDKRDGKDYLIEIMDEKWSSVITIEPHK
ncbi:MAG TPA: hypothetical protein VFC41_04110 [Anaerovoracaceae bacterium]|nr:hypothetical protein [Anaerovoracaceae bacterium]